MSIIKDPINQSPPPKEQLLSAKVKSIKIYTKKAYDNLVEIQNRGISMLWDDSNLTPQEIIDGLDANALKIFQLHGILTIALQNIEAIDGIDSSIALPSKEFGIVDGKIVVGDGPYVPV